MLNNFELAITKYFKYSEEDLIYFDYIINNFCFTDIYEDLINFGFNSYENPKLVFVSIYEKYVNNIFKICLNNTNYLYFTDINCYINNNKKICLEANVKTNNIKDCIYLNTKLLNPRQVKFKMLKIESI